MKRVLLVPGPKQVHPFVSQTAFLDHISRTEDVVKRAEEANTKIPTVLWIAKAVQQAPFRHKMLPNALVVIRDSTAHLVSRHACIVLQECTAIHLI